MNIYLILLELIQIRSFSGSLYRVLDALGSAVAECGKAIDKAEASGSLEYAEAVVQDECAVIENLIGAAFVTCQAEITAVVTHAMRIHKDAKAAGHPLAICDGTKAGIMSVQSPCVGTTPYSQIQVINAFANYFKHSDEWDAEWPDLIGQPKKTADIVSACGAKQYCTGNLRSGMKALGIHDYKHIHLLSKIVEEWAGNVRKAYEAELTNQGLV